MTAIYERFIAELDAHGITLANPGHVEAFITSHLRHDQYHSPHHPEGDIMSLTSIVSVVEPALASLGTALGDLKNIAGAVDNDGLVQAALNVADDVAPEVRAAVGELVPLLTGVHPSLIAQTAEAVKNVVSAFKAVPVP